jgi:uncharacterized protein
MVILLKPTLKCNNKCLHCYESPGRKEATLSFESAMSYLQRLHQIFDFKKCTIIFHGGEPLLAGYSFFKNVIESLDRSLYNRISIQTSLPDISDIDRIISLIGNYSTSFEYPISLHKDNIPQKVLSLYKKTGIKGHIINVLWKENEDVTGDRVYNFYKELGTPFRFNYMVPVGNAKENKDEIYTPLETWLKRIIEIFDSWFLDKTYIYVNPLLSIIESFLFRTQSICFLTDSCYRYILAVDPDGEIHQCGRLYKYSYGNINNISSIDDISKNPYYHASKVREFIIRKACRTCNYFYICNGGCKGNSMIAYGSFLEKDPGCHVYKRLLEHIEDKLDKNYHRAVDWLLNEIKYRGKIQTWGSTYSLHTGAI